MYKVILQLWEESNNNNDFLSNGCTLHLDKKDRNNYVDSIYESRKYSTIPDKYDRIIGDGIQVFISENLYNLLLMKKFIKLTETSYQNLKNFSEIIVLKEEV